MQRYPQHGVLGEEFGESNTGARVRWILDPIDGTRSFMHGVPLYGVLIGIEADGEPIVGVTYFPPLDEMVAAGKGLGCKWNGKPCHVSNVSKLSDAVVCTTDVERLLSKPIGAGWRRLQQSCAFSRTWGDCYGHSLVATGRIECQVDPVMELGRRSLPDHHDRGRGAVHHPRWSGDHPRGGAAAAGFGELVPKLQNQEAHRA